MHSTKKKKIKEIHNNIDYKYGFISNIEEQILSAGLNEAAIREISFQKSEPSWLLDFRLKSFIYLNKLLSIKNIPRWATLKLPNIDLNNICYFAAPPKQDNTNKKNINTSEIFKTYEKLGIPIQEQKKIQGIAVDAVLDSVSVATTFKKELENIGIIFSSFSEATILHSNLVKKYLGKVVSYKDNFYAALNSSVFSDGSFCFIPKNTKCPVELSTYFRINAANIGQFERTLIIAEESSYVSYLEGCTAPMRLNHQLHSAVVEIVALEYACVKYSTVQNWYPGNKEGNGGILNYVTKRGICIGNFSKISWVQIEVGSSITWKYPSIILRGKYSVGEFYSVAVTNNYQQADTGTKMIHLGEKSCSTIISKGISAGNSNNSYRGMVKILKYANYVENYSQCDSLILGNNSGGHTYPYISSNNSSVKIEHEASTSKISEEKIFYCQQRGLSKDDAINMIIHGFCKGVFNNLPIEFAVEARKLLDITLDNIYF